MFDTIEILKCVGIAILITFIFIALVTLIVVSKGAFALLLVFSLVVLAVYQVRN